LAIVNLDGQSILRICKSR